MIRVLAIAGTAAFVGAILLLAVSLSRPKPTSELPAPSP